jgi:hypothetical protein
MLYIAEKYLPTEDAKRASGEAFYVLCDNYEEWKDKKSFQDAIEDLRGTDCFPLKGIASSGIQPNPFTPLTVRRHSNLRRTFSISGIRYG